MKQSRVKRLKVSHILGVMLSVQAWTVSSKAEEEPDAASVGAARALAIDGVKLADSGDCAGAAVKLGQAENLYHSQVVASRLGECEIQLGQIVEGTERLRRLLREPVPEHATAAVLNAITRAKEVLERAAGKVANLQVAVTGPEPKDVSVKINGNVVPAAGLGVEFPVNPGAADIEVTAAGYYPQTEHVLLMAGEKLEVALTLKPEPREAMPLEAAPATLEPRVQAPPQHTASSQRPSATIEDGTQPSYAPAYVSFAVGAAGLAVGAFYGLSAKKDYDVLAPKCQNNICPAEQADNLDTAQTKGTIATVGLGVGAAAIVLGTVFALTTGSDQTPELSAGGLSPWFGTNELGVAGSF